jgi:hypothetical protein
VIDDALIDSLINQPATHTMILSAPRVVSHLSTQPSRDRQFSNLYDLYNQRLETTQDDLYRIKVFCVGFLPQKIEEFCQAYC